MGTTVSQYMVPMTLLTEALSLRAFHIRDERSP